MRIHSKRCLSRTLILSSTLFILGSSLGVAAPVSISYTTTLGFPGSATQAGEPSVFHMPFTADNGSQTVNGSAVDFMLGTFITDAFGVGNPSNPNVTDDSIQVTVTPKVGTITEAPLTFYAEITNPATGVYCFDVSATDSFNASLNCKTNNPSTYAVENFDGNLYELGISSYTLVNAVTKTTDLDAFVAPVPVPEPATEAMMGVALLMIGGLALRRKAGASKK